MKTNDIKKGTDVFLRGGRFGVMRDSLRGTTRLVFIEKAYRPLGQTFAHDITHAKDGGRWALVQHTKEQLKLLEASKRSDFS